jgi:hypothetical protein
VDESAQRIELLSQSFPARMTTDFVKSIDVTHVISQFETYFSRKGDQARRANVVITNNGSLEELQTNIQQAWDQLQQRLRTAAGR